MVVELKGGSDKGPWSLRLSPEGVFLAFRREHPKADPKAVRRISEGVYCTRVLLDSPLPVVRKPNTLNAEALLLLGLTDPDKKELMKEAYRRAANRLTEIGNENNA